MNDEAALRDKLRKIEAQAALRRRAKRPLLVADLSTVAGTGEAGEPGRDQVQPA